MTNVCKPCSLAVVPCLLPITGMPHKRNNPQEQLATPGADAFMGITSKAYCTSPPRPCSNSPIGIVRLRLAQIPVNA